MASRPGNALNGEDAGSDGNREAGHIEMQLISSRAAGWPVTTLIILLELLLDRGRERER